MTTSRWTGLTADSIGRPDASSDTGRGHGTIIHPRLSPQKVECHFSHAKHISQGIEIENHRPEHRLFDHDEECTRRFSNCDSGTATLSWEIDDSDRNLHGCGLRTIRISSYRHVAAFGRQV